MRPLVLLLALCALFLAPACQSESGPSSALDLQPGVGGGARVFAGPEDGVGCAARVDLGTYGFRTGKAAEPVPPTPHAVAAATCAGGRCTPDPAPFHLPEAPVLDAEEQP